MMEGSSGESQSELAYTNWHEAGGEKIADALFQ